MLDAAGGKDADETAHRKRNQRVDADIEQRTKCQKDDNYQRTANGSCKAGQLFICLGFYIGICDGIVFLLGKDVCQDNGNDQGAYSR